MTLCSYAGLLFTNWHVCTDKHVDLSHDVMTHDCFFLSLICNTVQHVEY